MYYWEDNRRDDTMMVIDFAVVATHGRALLLRQPCVAAAKSPKHPNPFLFLLRDLYPLLTIKLIIHPPSTSNL